jgi:hypothetical protein
VVSKPSESISACSRVNRAPRCRIGDHLIAHRDQAAASLPALVSIAASRVASLALPPGCAWLRAVDRLAEAGEQRHQVDRIRLRRRLASASWARPRSALEWAATSTNARAGP